MMMKRRKHTRCFLCRYSRQKLTAVLALAGALWLTAGCGEVLETAKWKEAQTTAQGTETVTPAGTETDVNLESASETEETVPETESVRETDEAVPAPETARPKVRGIYVTGPMAGTANMDNLIDLVDRTELNALVIDVKNDEGWVVCDMDAPAVDEIGSVKRYVRDMPALVEKCKEKGIYLIARIVAFKDPLLAKARPEWCLHNADGSVFLDKSGQAWVNPYEKQVWEYLRSVAEGAVRLGFDEVQFDYIRFSTDSGMKNVDFGPEAQEKTRKDVITEFTAYITQALHKMGAAVSADVYGVVIDREVDQQTVGQNYMEMARYLDYISPMVYPSHYGPYNYNIPVPDAQPYDTVLAAMQASKITLAGLNPAAGGVSDRTEKAEASDNGLQDGVSQNSAPDGIEDDGAAPGSVSENGILENRSAGEIAALKKAEGVRADVRPWLQDFTATWVKGHIKYGPEQIRQQIQAVYDAGYEEWILWNAANRYTEDGLYGSDGQPQGGV